MVAEPVAAAAQYPGEAHAIVVVRTASNYDVKAFDGLDDVGGLDLDGALVAWLRTNAGYREPTDPQARRVLWDEVRVLRSVPVAVARPASSPVAVVASVSAPSVSAPSVAGPSVAGPVAVAPHVAANAGLRTRWLVLGMSILLLLLAGAGFGVYKYLDRPDGSGGPTATPSSDASEQRDDGLNGQQQRLVESLVGHWSSTSYGDCYIRTDNGT